MKILKLSILVLTLNLLFAACSTDPCEDVVCVNGDCIDGTCDCVEGFEGVNCDKAIFNPVGNYILSRLSYHDCIDPSDSGGGFNTNSNSELCQNSTDGLYCFSLRLELKADKTFAVVVTNNTTLNGNTTTTIDNEGGTYSVENENRILLCPNSISFCDVLEVSSDKNSMEWIIERESGNQCGYIYLMQKI